MNEATQQLTELFKSCLDELAVWSYLSYPERIKTINLLRDQLISIDAVNISADLTNADYHRVRAANMCVLMVNKKPCYSIAELRQTLESGLSALIDK